MAGHCGENITADTDPDEREARSGHIIDASNLTIRRGEKETRQNASRNAVVHPVLPHQQTPFQERPRQVPHLPEVAAHARENVGQRERGVAQQRKRP